MSYFVKIEDSVGMRRRILESSKDLLHVLRGYHRILDIRDEKLDVAEQLKTTIADLNGLLADLEKVLPQKSLKEIEAYLPKRAKVAAGTKGEKTTSKGTKKTAKKVAPKKLSEVEKLERALSNIEDRLSRL